MKKLTEHEVYLKTQEIYKKIDIENKRKPQLCQFRSDKRYCTATTNESCKKCTFFEPTINTKIRLVVEHCMGKEEELANTKRDLYCLEDDFDNFFEISEENRKRLTSRLRKEKHRRKRVETSNKLLQRKTKRKLGRK